MTVLDLLAEAGVEHRQAGEDKHARVGWVQVRCCWCSSQAFHLGLALNGRASNCWTCGVHPLWESLAKVMGLSVGAVRSKLGPQNRGFDTPLNHAASPKSPKRSVLLPKGRSTLLPAHVRYLRGRGFDPCNLVAEWGIEGIGLCGRTELNWRVFIPIHLDGKVVSWTTRKVTDRGLRYLSAGEEEEAVAHKTLLYGEDKVTGGVCVVEGPLDVWKIGPGAVATFGTAVTLPQVVRLSKYARIVICFDSEPKAQAQAALLGRELAVFGGRVDNVQLDAKDAGSASEAELAKLRAIMQST